MASDGFDAIALLGQRVENSITGNKVARACSKETGRGSEVPGVLAHRYTRDAWRRELPASQFCRRNAAHLSGSSNCSSVA